MANCALTCSQTLGHWCAWIVEFEQDGADRAAYGEKLVPELAKNLNLPSLGASSLWACRQFFLQYPAILQTLSEESLTHTPQLQPILQTLSGESSLRHIPPSSSTNSAHWPGNGQPPMPSPAPTSRCTRTRLLQSLSFSHFVVELMKLDDPLKQTFYEIEAIRGALDRPRTSSARSAPCSSERTGLSHRQGKAHPSRPRIRRKPCDPWHIIRDPYVFEFLGLTPAEAMREGGS